MEVDGCNVDAVDGDASAVELDEPEERDEEGTLPRSRATDHANLFSRLHRE